MTAVTVLDSWQGDNTDKDYNRCLNREKCVSVNFWIIPENPSSIIIICELWKKKMSRKKNKWTITDKSSYHLILIPSPWPIVHFCSYAPLQTFLKKYTDCNQKKELTFSLKNNKCNLPHLDDVIAIQCVTSTCIPEILMRYHAVIVQRASNIFYRIGHFGFVWQFWHARTHNSWLWCAPCVKISLGVFCGWA